MIKALNKLEREHNLFNLIKAIYEKSIANITLNGKRLDAFLLRSEIGQGCLLLLLSILFENYLNTI